jgi:putative hydrolase of the HAD superfamily
MSQIGAVLFDFGGVLAEEGFMKGMESLAQEQRLDVENLSAAGAQAVYDSGFVLGQGSEADFWSLLRERTGLVGDDPSLTARVLAGFRLRPWMLELVVDLKAQGYVTAILSDQTHWLDMLDTKYHFYRYFDRVYNSFYLGKGKRDPSQFGDVAADLEMQPSAIVFIDDNADYVRSAISVGMLGIHYTERLDFIRTLMHLLQPSGDHQPAGTEFS